MFRVILFAVIFTIAAASSALAQDITGHWTGTVMEKYAVIYDFKQAGNVLTGISTHDA